MTPGEIIANVVEWHQSLTPFAQCFVIVFPIMLLCAACLAIGE